MVLALLFYSFLYLLQIAAVVTFPLFMWLNLFWRKKKVNTDNRASPQQADKVPTTTSQMNANNKNKDENVPTVNNAKESPKMKKGEKSAVTQASSDKLEAHSNNKSLAPTLFTFDALPSSAEAEVKTDLSAGDDLNPFAATQLQSRVMGPTTSKMNTVNTKAASPAVATARNGISAYTPVAETQESLGGQTPIGRKNREEAPTQDSPSVAMPPVSGNMITPTGEVKNAGAPSQSTQKPTEKEKSSISLYVTHKKA